MSLEGRVDTQPGGSRYWSIAEDDVCIQEYLTGIGWEERAAARLPGRTVNGIMAHAALLHLRTSGWMRKEMRKQGMIGGDA